jgi:hypothetical protein
MTDRPTWSVMIEPADHAQCADWLKDRFARLGAEVTISTLPPIVETVYEQTPFTCPHGTVFYHAPTSEQIAEWTRDGVA